MKLQSESTFSIRGEILDMGSGLLVREIELNDKSQVPTARIQIGIKPNNFLLWRWGEPDWVDTSDDTNLAYHGITLS